MALGTCAAKEKVPPAAHTHRAAHAPLHSTVSKTPPCKRHLRSHQWKNTQFELFLPNKHLTAPGKKGTLSASESKGSLRFCREGGNTQSKQDDWQLLRVCEMPHKKEYWKERLVVFGKSYCHCSVLFLNTVATDLFSLLIPQELNYRVSPYNRALELSATSSLQHHCTRQVIIV